MVMKLDHLSWLLAIVFLEVPLPTDAQQAAKIPRIGFVDPQHCCWYRGPLGDLSERAEQAWLDRGNECHHRIPVWRAKE